MVLYLIMQVVPDMSSPYFPVRLFEERSSDDNALLSEGISDRDTGWHMGGYLPALREKGGHDLGLIRP
jgi:hypothetical protein